MQTRPLLSLVDIMHYVHSQTKKFLTGHEPQILEERTRGERKQTENQNKKDFEKELKEN